MKTEFSIEQLADSQTAVSAQAIRKCVHCGFCTATCPTYVLLGDERDSPRGRIYLMKEMLEKNQRPTAEVVRHIDRCLSCLGCVSTCPSGVDYMHLVDHSRAYIERNYSRPWHERALRALLAQVLPYRHRLRWAIRLGRAMPSLSRGGSLGALQTLARASARANASATDTPTTFAKRGRVLLMQGCAESVTRPAIRAATVRFLNRLGYDVVFARGEQCCGALVHHLGREAQALSLARATIDAWLRVLESQEIDAIVMTTSGCGTLVKDYAHLLRENDVYAARAAKIGELAKDVSELVAPQDLVAFAQPRTHRIAYHAPCSLQHGQRIGERPKQLLLAVGFEVETPHEAHLCCGSAGTYNILEPELAARLGERKADHLDQTRGTVIATGNVGCATQIGLYSKQPVVHTVELLDWATGGPEPEAIRIASTAPRR